MGHHWGIHDLGPNEPVQIFDLKPYLDGSLETAFNSEICFIDTGNRKKDLEIASLVIAAPDLLESLENLLHYFPPVRPSDRLSNEALRRANKAIAKAKGEGACNVH